MTIRTFFLAWNTPDPVNAWFPIGRLDADLSKHLYRFSYTKGAEVAHKTAGLRPLDAFPNFRRIYEARELFPLFRARILDPQRADFEEYREFLDMPHGEVDLLDILAVTGGERQTDNLEVFPRVQQHKDGSFNSRFFLHGWRHINQHARERFINLKNGETLRVAVELSNPKTTVAIQLQTEDYCMIGWTPRYLVHDLIRVIDESPTGISAKIIKLNPLSAPAKLRVLVELRGHWPKQYAPMASSEFQLLIKK